MSPFIGRSPNRPGGKPYIMGPTAESIRRALAGAGVTDRAPRPTGISTFGDMAFVAGLTEDEYDRLAAAGVSDKPAAE